MFRDNALAAQYLGPPRMVIRALGVCQFGTCKVLVDLPKGRVIFVAVHDEGVNLLPRVVVGPLRVRQRPFASR